MDNEHGQVNDLPPTEEEPEVFAVSQAHEGRRFTRRNFIEITGVTAATVAASNVLASSAHADSAALATNTRTPTNCFVRTSRTDVNVHVGPGSHRGIRAILPHNEDIPVIGNANDAQGQLWWQIELPRIDQAWVSDSDVTTSGQCSGIGSVATPPVRTAQPNQPTATTTPGAQPTTGGAQGEPGQLPPGTFGINYMRYGIMYHLPCGAAIPSDATCICNCVSAPPATQAGGSGGGGGGGNGGCTCDQVCTCDTVHYWYPN